MIFPRLIRQIDPSAAPIDPGILSGIVLAIVAVLVFNSVTWWLIRVIWPVFADYSIHFLSQTLNHWLHAKSAYLFRFLLIVCYFTFTSFNSDSLRKKVKHIYDA